MSKLFTGMIFIFTTAAMLQAGSGLIKAAADGSLTEIRNALAQGEKVDEVDSSGWSPLMWAVYYRQASAASLLLEKGANPDLQSLKSRKSYEKGTTALMIAAFDCQEDLVKSLINAKARKDLTDGAGTTAEAYARKSECTAALEAMGTKVAYSAATESMLKEIEAGKDVNTVDAHGWTALMHAVACEDQKTVEALLQRGAKPDLPSTQKYDGYEPGVTALIIAGYRGLDDLARILLKAKADPALKDASGRTAVDWARENRYTTTVGALGEAIDPKVQELIQSIQNGKIDVNARLDAGWTPLLLAAYTQDLPSARRLLGLGADPNLQSKEVSNRMLGKLRIPDGSTALMLAVRLEQKEMVELLRERNANRDLRDGSGKTAEDRAIEEDLLEMQDAMLLRTPIARRYTRIVLKDFEGGEAKRAFATELVELREGMLAALRNSGEFDSVEPFSPESKLDESTLILQIEFQALDIPRLIGSPKTTITLRMLNGSTGTLDRAQSFRLTTGERIQTYALRKARFLKLIKTLIPEYCLLATGKVPPLIAERAKEISNAPIFDARTSVLSGIPTFSFAQRPAWQRINQLPIYPTCVSRDFQFASIASAKIAVWPVASADVEEPLERTIKSMYSNVEEFLIRFSSDFSERWVRLGAKDSLGVDAVKALLAQEQLQACLETSKIVPWAGSCLLANKLSPSAEPVLRLLRAQGVKYAVLPHQMYLGRTTMTISGPAGPGPGTMTQNYSKNESCLGISIFEVATGKFLWNGPVMASTEVGGWDHEALKAIREGLLENMENALRDGK